ncbi:MAG: hypothetical protein ACFFAU_15540 [Candidatus Hodarchaeota archaeon]
MPPPKGKKEKLKDLPEPPLFDTIIEPPNNLPPPPGFSRQIVQRPPFPEPQVRQKSNKTDSMAIADDLTGDLLDEIRELGFGAFLDPIPLEKTPEPSFDERISARYLEAKEVYLDAGRKHQELDFTQNAAMNYSCAILCAFLGKDVFEASHIIKDLASTLPPPIINNFAFQGVKMLLKANLLNDFSLLDHARNWLLKDSDHLYKEDKDVILRAIKLSVKNITSNLQKYRRK